ncbi:hypothetical protein COCC4DRAFT_60455 [Bipolaris maydis ATCC 48331]|uniref:Uncharacterized protein n=3 Tax=Cochliobolus heterostrophus TaxID=5016 RepID=M2ULT0_COCH5|nr:uncharacterized protein COCC4DRAFT_60455 [Bipolaris maydis ATCC 48331]EMD88877.1 hypothetical protein COCHEDRAFT_1216748 [Bipolaris maydis C5]ENI05408.1 hypothetical protein COCC4DRAFT_60455 [Bipolaris maydis ATCC 48331]KAH7556490.1 hypothetical protein BM1_05924 [Bipolaris maydis]
MFLCIPIFQIAFLPKKIFVDFAKRSVSLSRLSRRMKKNIIIFLSLAIQADAKCTTIPTCGDPSDPICIPGKANKCNWFWDIHKLRDECGQDDLKCFDGECHGVKPKYNQEQSATFCYVMCCQNESDIEDF